MNENEIITVDEEVTDLTARPQGGGLLDSSTDNILYLAEQADKYIIAMNKIMDAALKITSELDWCLIGGTPYLQESGATKVARLFGISIQLIGKPIIECDPQGYKTFTYKARFVLKDQFIECEGSRSASEEFFAGKGKTKKPDEIDERDVKMAAYTNCINNGIKRLIPNLRNIDVETLERAGLEVGKIRGYTFKTGSKGGNSGKKEDSGLTCSKCNAAITQAEASYSEAKYGARLCRKCQAEAKNDVQN
ncbi:MAG: hypothetical protein ACI4MS_03280 [Candidatus Coproplasma sp.]